MGETEYNAQHLEIKVALLEQNMNNFKSVFDRLDTAIEKIGDVSGVIKQMLAVHEQRIANLDDRINYHKNNAEVTNESFKTDVKELHSRITTSETKILEKQDEMEERILASMKDVKSSLANSNKSLENRVKTLEIWRWILVGMGTAIGLLLEYVYDILSKP